MAMKRGLFIVFEGCDRCGKSTQSKLLTEFLQSQNVCVQHLRFPARDSEIGKVIDLYLQSKQELSDEAIHLLFSANRWESMNAMKKLLGSGVTLVVDRYSYSGVAYSVAKGLAFDWCVAPEIGLIRPDVVFYLSAQIKALEERGYGIERYEKLEFQQRVSKVFQRIYENEKSYWLKINAENTPEDVHREISSIVLEKLGNIQNEPLEKLVRTFPN